MYNNVGETIINNSYDEISLNLQKELKNRPLADAYQYVITALNFSFYENNKELSGARLTLLKACSIVLKDALSLIGVNAPEKM